MEKDAILLIVGGLIGFVGGLSKDIIFSWLNTGRSEKNQSSPLCSDHREKLARIEARLDVCEVELSKGEKRFSVIQDNLEKINKTLAVLLDRSSRRRDGEMSHDPS